MKYADQSGSAMSFAVHKWKPITPNELSVLLHHWATHVADEHGNSSTLVKSYRLDRHCNATIYHHTKFRNGTNESPRIERVQGVYTPYAMTMNSKEGKIVCFEYIGDGNDGLSEEAVAKLT